MELINKNIKKYHILEGLAVFILQSKILVAQAAAKYVLLEPTALTGQNVTSGTPVDLMTYLRGAYQTFFVVVFVAAVISFVFGGIEYMLTDIATKKNEGKSRIQNALYGMAIAVISYLILYVVNPDLVKLQLSLGS